MKTILYYFTGTGNTLAVARDLAAELGDTKLIPLRLAMHPGGICPDADAVGIAFPVYFLDMPAIVRKFVENIRFTGRPYLFGIATCGERPGGALFSLKTLLEQKETTLSNGFVVVMPENYIGPVDLMGDAGHRQEKYTGAKSRIAAIAAAVRDRKVAAPEGTNSALLKFGGAVTRTLMTSVYNVPGRLHATAACSHCGTCTRICPTHNITTTPDGVRWGRNCTQCYACIHWCPQGAVEIGGRTAGKPRYHHPDVTIKDMLDQRGE
ncbi:EFR1 family ferrodoxin [Methanoregula sp.]|uniref:EFR1 family ferrodoxin n=1 Tax=Methanoregula sp. TaxID=2052170 RepID=UPI003569D6B5